MTIKRKLTTIHTPMPHQGFLGAGHTARAVIQREFAHSDPFIMLMDDELDKKDDAPAGGPHPHAGFETVTLVLEGKMGDGTHVMEAGDFQMMTAGKGVIHSETIDTEAKVRILQLWLTLPKKDRWTTPRVQDVRFENVRKTVEDSVEARLYSGSFAGLAAPILNYVPVIIADIHLAGGASTLQQLPASFNTFLYLIEGEVEIGEDGKLLHKGQVGWLDRYEDEAQTELKLAAGASGARLVLYAGQPQQEAIVPYGPFIGDSREDIMRLYQEYQQGRMKHISTMPETQQLRW